MDKREKEDYKYVAAELDYDDLVGTIMGLETELMHLKQYLKKDEIKDYETIISIHEAEKALRLSLEGSSINIFGYTYGLDYLCGWNDDY